MNKVKTKTGDRFGKLTTVSYFKAKPNGYWLCKCDCGNETNVMAGNLRNNGTKSCGCLLKSSTLELVGKRFGNIEVLDITEERSNQGDILVKCRCDCGKEKNMNSSGIKKGTIVSCGCKIWKSDLVGGISVDYWNRVQAGAKKRSIDFNITREWAWEKALQQKFKCVYTGRDLEFSTKRWERTASLDRIDSSKGYTEENTQWIYRPINYMKSNFSEKDFLQYVREIFYKMESK